MGSLRAAGTIIMKDADFLSLASGKLNGQQAFMQGKLKLKAARGCDSRSCQ